MYDSAKVPYHKRELDLFFENTADAGCDILDVRNEVPSPSSAIVEATLMSARPSTSRCIRDHSKWRYTEAIRWTNNIHESSMCTHSDRATSYLWGESRRRRTDRMSLLVTVGKTAGGFRTCSNKPKTSQNRRWLVDLQRIGLVGTGSTEALFTYRPVLRFTRFRCLASIKRPKWCRMWTSSTVFRTFATRITQRKVPWRPKLMSLKLGHAHVSANRLWDAT